MPPSPLPPHSLYLMQKQFAETARTPFFFGETVTPQPDHYNDEIVAKMVSVKGITGRKRILSYNQQYWYRLFTTMQDEYPLLTYLLGYQEFNRLVSDYLTECPSRHYSLNFLSEDLPAFLNKSKEWGQALYVETVALERIFIKAFDALQKGDDLRNIPLTREDLSTIGEKGVGFQPSWFLWEESWNLVALRKKVVQAKDPEALQDKPVEAKGYWCIYRQDNRLNQEVLNRSQYLLLRHLFDGSSLIEAFEKLELQLSSKELEIVEKEVSQWFTHWVAQSWFTLPQQKGLL